ncbi:hypothetical protein CFP56_042043 [Quercus suber]|uniref:Uncharacterized protein n=1 Tax=Quercus suber TaxID=58331 RepID=A0AAW0IU71_QUESU
MRSKIDKVDARLQRIVTEMNGLGLIENTGRRTRTTRSWVPTTSLLNEGHANLFLAPQIHAAIKRHDSIPFLIQIELGISYRLSKMLCQKSN